MLLDKRFQRKVVKFKISIVYWKLIFKMFFTRKYKYTKIIFFDFLKFIFKHKKKINIKKKKSKRL